LAVGGAGGFACQPIHSHLLRHYEITAAVPRLQTDSPEVGTSLSNRELIDLPLSFSGFRKPENFACKISPGV